MSRLYSRREKIVDNLPPQKEIDYPKIRFNLYIINNWRYCGGNMNKDLDYYRILNPNRPVPSEEEQDFCICGRYLRKERYYIKRTVNPSLSSDEYILTVGKCCYLALFKNK